MSPPNFANYLREWHALNESGEFTEQRYEELRRKHQYSDGRAFLSAVLGNSVWEGPAPWGEIKFDAAGMKADYGGNGRAGGGFRDNRTHSPDGLGFVGEWRQTRAAEAWAASRSITTLHPEQRSLSSRVMILAHKALGESRKGKQPHVRSMHAADNTWMG